MGFSVQSKELNLEYSGESALGLFGHIRNIFDLKHWNMVREILRFHESCEKSLDNDETVDSFLQSIVLEKDSPMSSSYLLVLLCGHVQLKIWCFSHGICFRLSFQSSDASGKQPTRMAGGQRRIQKLCGPVGGDFGRPFKTQSPNQKNRQVRGASHSNHARRQ